MILIWALLFLILQRLLNAAFFKPYMLLIEKRESATSGAIARAQECRRKTEELAAQYEDKITAIKVKAIQSRLETMGRAKRDADLIVEKAEKAAQELVASSRAALSAKLAELRNEVPTHAAALADILVRKLETGEGSVSRN